MRCFSVAMAIVLLVRNCKSFNIDVNETKRLLPARDETTTTQELSEDLNGFGNEQSANVSSYFGFDIAYQSNGAEIRLSVGSPKFSNAPSSSEDTASNSKTDPGSELGNIYTCPVTNAFASSSDILCESISPPSQEGDSFGLDLGTGQNDVIVACTPRRAQNCTNDRFTPGYCYRSQDGGETWEMEQRTSNIDCPHQKLDLIFLLDGSGSVGDDSFVLVKNWVVNVTNRLDLSQNVTKVGVIQYSSIVANRTLEEQIFMVTEITLDFITDFEDFTKEVNDIKLQRGLTYTAYALTKALYDFQQSSRFSDSAVAKVLILLTDGQSDDFSDLEANAQEVRDNNITTFAVGVADAERKQLGIVATGDANSTERVYFVTDFNKLDEVVDKIQKDIEFSLEGSSKDASLATYTLEQGEIGLSLEFGVNQVTYNFKISEAVLKV